MTVKVEYKLTTEKCKKVNEKIDLGIVFDDAFKTDNDVLSILSGANEMIGWIVGNFISREVNAVLKICKTLIRPHTEYHSQVWAPVLKHGN